MRLWSLNLKLLDQKGLVALWREALLAQAVLLGETKGYKKHPQLDRFRDNLGALSVYLSDIVSEAESRGYSFDRSKVRISSDTVSLIPVNLGQVLFEYDHLVEKLRKRDKKHLANIEKSDIVLCNEKVFKSVFNMNIEKWEKV